jgi:hypothetical protein
MTVQKKMIFNKLKGYCLACELRLLCVVRLSLVRKQHIHVPLLHPLVRKRHILVPLLHPSVRKQHIHVPLLHPSVRKQHIHVPLLHPLVRKRHILVPLLPLLLLFFITPLNADSPAQPVPQQQDASKPVLSAQALQRKKADNGLKYHALYAEQWEISRSGESVLFLPVLNQVIYAWLEDRQKKIEIQYPGGEEGEFWVHELTDWLVSLGIPSNHMVVVPGSGADDVIKFALIK